VAARPNGGPQSPDALVDDIEKTRDQLAETIDALVDRASPANIASRQLDRLKAQFVAEDGSPRVDQISKAAGAVLGFLTVIVLIRRVAG
jgi:hypothetical protein